MSDERTLDPGRRRRLQAREAGRVPHSPDLTAAVGLLSTSILLGLWGDELAGGLVDLVRMPLLAETAPGAGPVDPGAIAVAIRHAAGRVAGPLLGLLAGAGTVMAMAHLIQTGFLWTPARLSPDPGRLVGGIATTPDPLAALKRGIWAVARTAVLVGAAGWVLGSDLPDLARLAALDPIALATSCAEIARDLLGALGAALAVLGVGDFALRWRRLEASLRMTPEEGRQEQREQEGDPALRGRRRDLVRSWRHDPSDLLPGASMLLTGPPNLAVLLAGGPPPGRPVAVRRVARGKDARELLRTAEAHGLRVAEAPRLARFLARGNSSASILPQDLAGHLAAIWPVGDAPSNP